MKPIILSGAEGPLKYSLRSRLGDRRKCFSALAGEFTVQRSYRPNSRPKVMGKKLSELLLVCTLM
jgi:hypothetical protein